MAPMRDILSFWAFWALLLAPALIFSMGTGDEVCTAEECKEATLKDTNEEGYFWRRRGGSNEVITSVPFTAPTDLSKGPTWSWPNDLDEQVRHSPLLDGEKNIYVATAVRIRKFTRTGKLLWTWETGKDEGKMVTSPALEKGTIYALANHDKLSRLTFYALSMETGQLQWKRRMEKTHAHMDANSLLVFNDTILFAGKASNIQPDGYEGNDQVRAVRASDGSDLWTYQMDDVVWNMLLSTPGDGTLMFSSTCGTVYRLGWNGQLIWQSGRPPSHNMCGCGGGVLGPNGIFYSAFNSIGNRGGFVSAHKVSNGELVWERAFPFYLGGWQYPGVGKIAPNGRLAVLAPLGLVTQPTRFPGLSSFDHSAVPFFMKNIVFQLYLKFKWFRKRIVGVPDLSNALAALDAETGKDIWWVWEEMWDYFAAAGDEEPVIRRATRFQEDPSRHDVICLPDNQGIPIVAGDGFVYASSGHNGDVMSVADKNMNGRIELDEMSVYKTGNCFLNSPSLAPGMVVAAPCWGPMHVFLDVAAQ